MTNWIAIFDLFIYYNFWHTTYSLKKNRQAMRIICKTVGDSIHDRSPNVETIQISKTNEKKKKYIYIYISLK